jgi:hypothetical protein
LTLTLAIVLLVTVALLLARGRIAGAVVLAALAVPVLLFAARRQRDS